MLRTQNAFLAMCPNGISANSHYCIIEREMHYRCLEPGVNLCPFCYFALLRQ